MFQKGSFAIPCDSSGILLVKVIQTRRCSTRKHADIGKFLRIVLKNTKFKLTKRRRRKYRAIVVRSQRIYRKKFGSYYQFGGNDLVLLKKRMNTVGKELYGPTSKQLKIRKFRVAFRHVYKVKLFMYFFSKILNKPSVKFYLNLFYLKASRCLKVANTILPNIYIIIIELKLKFFNNSFTNLYVYYILCLILVITLIWFFFTVI